MDYVWAFYSQSTVSFRFCQPYVPYGEGKSEFEKGKNQKKILSASTAALLVEPEKFVGCSVFCCVEEEV